jgi:hypothetical protein
VREGLECRKPDIDGRKTRWKKGRTSFDTNMDYSAGLEKGSSGVECRGSGQGDSGPHHSGGIFDLLMGEHDVHTTDLSEDRADTAGSEVLHAGPSMSGPESRGFRQGPQATHSNDASTQPFPVISDRNYDPGYLDIQVNQG